MTTKNEHYTKMRDKAREYLREHNSDSELEEIEKNTGLTKTWMRSVLYEQRTDPGGNKIETLLTYAGIFNPEKAFKKKRGRKKG